MVLIFFTFSVVGMSLFSEQKYGNNYNDDVNFKSNMDDFEILFKKLVSDFGECLDDDENEMQEDKIEIDLKKR